MDRLDHLALPFFDDGHRALADELDDWAAQHLVGIDHHDTDRACRALVRALGGTVSEREGSRVKIELNGQQWRCHRPHPGKEAKRYQVEEARELLSRAGVQP